VLDYARDVLQQRQQESLKVDTIRVRDFDPGDLLFARLDSPAIQAAHRKVADAHVVIIATPVYKAAYSGVLKSYLDLLPQRALADKTVLPIATGGSLAHLLSIDYALKPVLSALGAQHILQGLYIQDSQIRVGQDLPFQLDAEIELRLNRILDEVVHHLFRFHAPAIADVISADAISVG
jgi:FMN reductase